jgi:hypothetical protein
MKLTKVGKFIVVLIIFWVLLLLTLNVIHTIMVPSASNPKATVAVTHDIVYYSVILGTLFEQSKDHDPYSVKPKYLIGFDEKKFKNLVKKHIPSEYTVILKRDNNWGYFHNESKWVCTLSKDTLKTEIVW